MDCFKKRHNGQWIKGSHWQEWACAWSPESDIGSVLNAVCSASSSADVSGNSLEILAICICPVYPAYLFGTMPIFYSVRNRIADGVHVVLWYGYRKWYEHLQDLFLAPWWSFSISIVYVYTWGMAFTTLVYLLSVPFIGFWLAFGFVIPYMGMAAGLASLKLALEGKIRFR